MKLFPNSFTLPSGHSLVSVFDQFFIFISNSQVEILFVIVFSFVNSFCQFLHGGETHFGFFSSALRAKCLLVSLDFEKTDFVLFGGVFKQGGWDFFRLDKDFGGVLLFFSDFDSEFFEGLLIDGSDITEPLSVGIDSGSFSGSLMHFLFIGHFLSVHLESLDGIGGPESVVGAISVALDFPIGIGGRVGFGLFVELVVKSFIVPCERFLFF